MSYHECVLEVLTLSLFLGVFLLDIGNVPTVCYFFVFYFNITLKYTNIVTIRTPFYIRVSMKEQQLKLINTEHLTSQYSAIGSPTPYKHEGKVITPERSNRPILKVLTLQRISKTFWFCNLIS